MREIELLTLKFTFSTALRVTTKVTSTLAPPSFTNFYIPLSSSPPKKGHGSDSGCGHGRDGPRHGEGCNSKATLIALHSHQYNHHCNIIVHLNYKI